MITKQQTTHHTGIVNSYGGVKLAKLKKQQKN